MPGPSCLAPASPTASVLTSAYRLHCPECGSTAAPSSGTVQCPSCGGLLDLEIDPRLDGRGAEPLRTLFAARRATAHARGVEETERALDRSGVWRFRELVLPDVGRDGVAYPEGNTPLLQRDAVSAWAGAEAVLMKHEGMNPTGSFKDRGMAVAVTQARRVGARAVLSASTGNTSSSMAAYAAIAGLRAVVLVPAGRISPAKLAQTMAYGARTVAVRGDFDACLQLARDAADRLALYLVNSVNPYRIAGQKTIVFELLEQLGWDPPDWIILPAGNLGNASAFGAALRDAVATGLIARAPRLGLVQASGAAPFVESFRGGFSSRVRVTPETVASAIRIGDPASFDRAVRVVRETRGVVVAVPDDDILGAKRVLDGAGVGCEPASAAALAGVRALIRDGTVGKSERVVAVLTGHLLKDVGTGHDADRSTPVEIEPLVSELERALAR